MNATATTWQISSDTQGEKKMYR